MAEDFNRIVDLGAALNRDIAALLPQEVKRLHVATAKGIKATEMRTNNFKPAEVQTIVDGRTPATEDDVKPFGVITYRFGSIVQIAFEIRDWLMENSPAISGEYRESWFAIINGATVAWDALEGAWKPGDEIWISNDQPYSRMLEVGKKRFTVPLHLTHKAVVNGNRRFGNLVRLRDTFIDLHGEGSGRAAEVPWILRRSQGRKGRRKGDPINYPAVIISPL